MTDVNIAGDFLPLYLFGFLNFFTILTKWVVIFL